MRAATGLQTCALINNTELPVNLLSSSGNFDEQPLTPLAARGGGAVDYACAATLPVHRDERRRPTHSEVVAGTTNCPELVSAARAANVSSCASCSTAARRSTQRTPKAGPRSTWRSSGRRCLLRAAHRVACRPRATEHARRHAPPPPAAQINRFDTTTLLLDARADPLAKNANGRCPPPLPSGGG